MSSFCARAGGVYPCPAERVSDLRATEHVLRPAALRVCAHPEGHLSLPGSVLLRLLDENVQLGRSLSRAEDRMLDDGRKLTDLRAEKDSWRKTAVDLDERALRLEAKIQDAINSLTSMLDDLEGDTRPAPHKGKRNRRQDQSLPKHIIVEMKDLLRRLEEPPPRQQEP